MTSKDGHKAFLTERHRLTADQALDVLGRASQRANTELVAEADGGRLAAAVTCYAFFAAFALGLLAFAVFGFVLDDRAGRKPFMSEAMVRAHVSRLTDQARRHQSRPDRRRRAQRRRLLTP